jgi:polyvinyl alcohol dehydrogenase (cytochrome)
VLAGCGGNVESTKNTGETPPEPEPDPKVETATADWTMLAYDLKSTYWNRGETKVTKATAAELTKAWVFDTKAGVNATPVISKGRVYLASYGSASSGASGAGIVALDLATGSVIWQNNSVSGAASLALEQAILYQHDLEGTVRALDAETGQVLWEHKSDEHPSLAGFSSPVVSGDLVLVGGSSSDEALVMPGAQSTFRGFVLALDKRDGTLAWKKHTVEPPYNGAGIWSTLSIDEAAGVVVASTANNYTGEASDTSDAFLALPLANGTEFIWKSQMVEGAVFSLAQTIGNMEGDFGANPVLFEVQGRKLAAGGNKGGDVWVLDRSDGSIIQRRNFSPASPYKGGVFNNGAWDGSSLLFVVNGATSSGTGSEAASPENAATLFALDPLTLDIEWERGINGPAFSPITVANGVGFFGKNRTLQAFDTSSGEVLMEFATEGTISSAPAVSNGYVVFASGMSWIGTSRGTLYYALKVP